MFKRVASVFRPALSPLSARTFVSFARPVSRPLGRSLPSLADAARQAPAAASVTPVGAPQSILDIFSQQRRFKSRGNTYQPSTLKRKRRAGFLARLRTKGGRKVLSRRKTKGRWFLTY